MAETPAPILVYNRIDANRRNTRLLIACFVALVLPLAWGLSQFLAPVLAAYTGAVDRERPFQANTFAQVSAFCIVLLAAILAVALAYLGSLFSSILIWRAGARKLRHDEEAELRGLVENLCIATGLPVPSLYVSESPAPNAFAVGYDPNHASLVVSRGLLKLLDRRELSGVLAHELSHIGNRDTNVSTTLAAVVTAVRLPLTILLGMVSLLPRVGGVLAGVRGAIAWMIGGYLVVITTMNFVVVVFATWKRIALGLSAGQAAAMLVPAYVFVVAPGCALLLRKKITHQREFLADADAALVTRDPEGLALALAKVSAAAGVPVHADAATAHMCFIDPLPPSRWSWWRGMFPSHPPVDARIALLTRMGDGIVERLAAAADEGVNYRGEMLLRQYAPGIQPTAAKADVLGNADVATHYTPGTRIRLTDTRTALYRSPDRLSGIVADLDASVELTLLGTDGAFYHVRAADDQPGYIDRTAGTARSEARDDDPDSRTGHGIHYRAAAGPAFTARCVSGSAFRLTDHLTPLYAKADGWSGVLRQLSAGDIVTFVGLEGHFAHVRTAHAEGYIPRLAGAEALSAQPT
jgi:heat shock protein HtpX